MAQQTAVEWIAEKMKKLTPPGYQIEISAMLRKAKQMEKEQIMDACIHTASKLSDVGLSDITINGEIELAEQYYNETFGNEGV